MLDAMKPLMRATLAFAIALLAFGGVTWFALEGRDVAILRTKAADGAVRETHVWVAEENGALFLEAATPERAWLLEAQSQPVVELVHAGATTRYRAVPEPGDAGHAKIRRLLRAKYGWADQWVALLQDTSRSLAVRLEAVK
jgi:hypothetical protein